MNEPSSNKEDSEEQDLDELEQSLADVERLNFDIDPIAQQCGNEGGMIRDFESNKRSLNDKKETNTIKSKRIKLDESINSESITSINEEKEIDKEDLAAKPKKKRLVMIRTEPDGTKTRQVIPADDPILQKVIVTKIRKSMETENESTSSEISKRVKSGITGENVVEDKENDAQIRSGQDSNDKQDDAQVKNGQEAAQVITKELTVAKESLQAKINEMQQLEKFIDFKNAELIKINLVLAEEKVKKIGKEKAILLKSVKSSQEKVNNIKEELANKQEDLEEKKKDLMNKNEQLTEAEALLAEVKNKMLVNEINVEKESCNSFSVTPVLSVKRTSPALGIIKDRGRVDSTDLGSDDSEGLRGDGSKDMESDDSEDLESDDYEDLGSDDSKDSESNDSKDSESNDSKDSESNDSKESESDDSKDLRNNDSKDLGGDDSKDLRSDDSKDMGSDDSKDLRCDASITEKDLGCDASKDLGIDDPISHGNTNRIPEPCIKPISEGKGNMKVATLSPGVVSLEPVQYITGVNADADVQDRIQGTDTTSKWRIIFMDCEKISDGDHSQFTQIGCYVYRVLNGTRGSCFLPMYPTKHKEYLQMKQKSNVLNMLHLTWENEIGFQFIEPDGEQVKAVSESDGLEKFLIFLKRKFEGEENLLFVNSAQIILPLLFKKIDLHLLQKNVSGICELGTFLGQTGGEDFTDISHTDDIYRKVMGESFKNITPTCAQTAKYMFKIVEKIWEDKAEPGLNFEKFISMSKSFQPISYFMDKFVDHDINRNEKSRENKIPSGETDSREDTVANGDTVLLEIENSFRPEFRATVNMLRVDLVDLTELTEEDPQSSILKVGTIKVEPAVNPHGRVLTVGDYELEPFRGKTKMILVEFEGISQDVREVYLSGQYAPERRACNEGIRILAIERWYEENPRCSHNVELKPSIPVLESNRKYGFLKIGLTEKFTSGIHFDNHRIPSGTNILSYEPKSKDSNTSMPLSKNSDLDEFIRCNKRHLQTISNCVDENMAALLMRKSRSRFLADSRKLPSTLTLPPPVPAGKTLTDIASTAKKAGYKTSQASMMKKADISQAKIVQTHQGQKSPQPQLSEQFPSSQHARASGQHYNDPKGQQHEYFNKQFHQQVTMVTYGPYIWPECTNCGKHHRPPCYKPDRRLTGTDTYPQYLLHAPRARARARGPQYRFTGPMMPSRSRGVDENPRACLMRGSPAHQLRSVGPARISGQSAVPNPQGSSPC